MVSTESTIVKEEFTYGEGKFVGFIAYDSAKKGQLPGILVLHEAPGFGEYVKRRAIMLAELGYIGFAVDLVGGGKGYCKIADADASLVPFETVREKFYKAYDVLKAHDKCDPTKLAGIGYCYGGIVLTNLVREGIDVRGIANFHGPVRPFVPMQKGKFKGKALFCNGDLDTLISKEEIENFKKEFDEAAVDYKFINYPDTYHAFTNPDADEIGKRTGLPIAYNEKSDKESWGELLVFLKDIFSD